MVNNANIARHLPLMAARRPGQAAVKIPCGRAADGRIDYLTLNFRELDAEVDAWVTHLSDRGVRAGDRVLVMVRQGLPLIAAAFALFKLGAVPVIIDPGMGRKNFLACVARSRPRVLLGIPAAQFASHFFRSAFSSVKVRVWVSGNSTARIISSGGTSSRWAAANREVGPPPVTSSATDLAAILFTSGSTGAPKGVCYEHGMFDAQIRLVRDTYRIEPGEVDLPMLPIFALFNPALGMTTVVPEIDPSRPASVDPGKIVQAILQEKVTNSFGSPTLWRKIFDYCLARNLTLPSLRRVLCAGAAVPASLWTEANRVLVNGELHSPYGATEVLPVATVSAREVPTGATGGGLLGRPLPENRVKIITPQDGPIASLDQVHELPAGEIGEIIVTGPTVTREYDGLPEATTAAKIKSPFLGTWPLELGTSGAADAAPVWHRMGDAGYLDAEGKLWFCGRLAERVITAAGVLYPEPCEQVFRSHPRVVRCALIGLGPRGQQEPALVVQPGGGQVDEEVFARELRQLAIAQAQTTTIKKFFFHPDFPVDVRHNAKIHRLTLAKWASTAKVHEPEIAHG